MRKCVIIIILLGITGILVGPARATIVKIGCYLDPQNSERHTLSWSFDYDLRLLTVEEVIYKTDPKWQALLGVGGLADSVSTFSVELTITNETGVEWIGFELANGPPPVGTGVYITPDNIESTKLQTITSSYEYGAWFLSEPPAVFDGESFTISFDMRTGDVGYSRGAFGNYVRQIPVYVPEPATVVLFGIGGLALLKKHKP